MSVPVKGDIPRVWTPEVARQITERLQALERDSAKVGGAAVFVSPTPTLPPATGGGGSTTTIVNEFDPAILDGYVQHHEGATPLPHDHLTGNAVDLSDQPSAGGVSTLLARADHTHLKHIEAEDDGTSLGNVSAVNLIGPGLDVVTEPNFLGDLYDDLYAYWPLDETSGTRAKKYGTAATANLAEVAGTVASEAGKFGMAVSSDYTSAPYLEVSCTPISLATGFTFMSWFQSHSESAGGGSHAYQNLALLYSGTDFIRIVRHRLAGGTTAGWMNALSSIGGGTTNMTADVDDALIPTRTDWHSLFVWVDPATELLYVQVNDRPPVVGTLFTGLTDLSAFTLDKVQLVIPSTWDAWDGLVDAVSLWPRPLTAAERARMRVNFRATVSVNPHFRTAALPHTHSAAELMGLETIFPPRQVDPHQHGVADIADLRYNDPQFMNAVQTYGG